MFFIFSSSEDSAQNGCDTYVRSCVTFEEAFKHAESMVKGPYGPNGAWYQVVTSDAQGDLVCVARKGC